MVTIIHTIPALPVRLLVPPKRGVSPWTLEQLPACLGARRRTGAEARLTYGSRRWRSSTCAHGGASTRCARPNTARLNSKDRRFIKGQKHTLLARRENLSLEGRRFLKLLFAANKRLNTACLLKECFGQIQRFAAMIERHCNGIAAFCKPDNKVPLGFVEGVNNKIRVPTPRCSLRDRQYLRLNVLAGMLDPL